jgi:glycosyltransferase involved in cell wall biosynthesis
VPAAVGSPPKEVLTLSVIIPCYNHSTYLGLSLRAFIEQTTPPDEIIVVDDASTDDSCAVAEQVAAGNQSVRIIRHAENYGPLRAVNRGLSEARGEFICLAAADDIVAPDFAQRSLDALRGFPDAALCFSDPVELIGDTGVIRTVPLQLSEQPSYFPPQEFEQLMRRNYFTISANTVVYRRAALDAFGGIREDLDWLVEWITNNGLALRHGACYVPGALAYLRVAPSTYSAIRVRRTAEQRVLLLRSVDLLHGPDFTDIAPRFRRAALLPEMRLRALFWLLVSSNCRSYITPRLVGRLIARELWSAAKPLVPSKVRRVMRKISARFLGKRKREA